MRKYRDEKGRLVEDRRVDERRHDYCEMVLKNNRELGELSKTIVGMDDDIKYVRKKVDNGLSEKLDTLASKLSELDKNSWLVKILNKGATSLILFVLATCMLAGASSAGIWGLTRIFYFEEHPGQIRQLSDAVSSNGYVLHTTPDGNKIMTANDSTKPAWIFCADVNQWKPAPQYRIIDGKK